MPAMERRHSTVYVEVPPSPYPPGGATPLKRSANTSSASARKPKAIADLEHASQSSSALSTLSTDPGFSEPRKRRLSYPRTNRAFVEINTPDFLRIKKRRVETAYNDLENTKSIEFPNGPSNCHQCTRKSDLADVFICNALRESLKSDKKPCKTRYCRRCLEARYADSIKVPSATAKTPFKCPKCRQICSCAKCRKAHGLAPIGRLADKPTPNNLPESLEAPAMKGASDHPGKKSVGKDVTTQAKFKKSEKENGLVQPRTTNKKTVQDLPKIKWTVVPTFISRQDAEARIQVREFLLRFSNAVKIPRVFLEELDRVGGNGDSLEQDEDDLVDWVSEPCVKAIVAGLLELFTYENSTASGAIKSAIEDIRNSSANLNKLWSALASLRDKLSSLDSQFPLEFPDPLPVPLSLSIRGTRSATAAGTHVAISSQLAPVIAGLIESAVHTSMIRVELDAGAQACKELGALAREAIKISSAKKEKSKAQLNGKADTSQDGKKSGRPKQDCIMSEAIVSSDFASRFEALGTDHQGRIYYALTPSLIEREHAHSILNAHNDQDENAPKLTMKSIRMLRPPEEERSEMGNWSWFLAVWGTRPHGEEKESHKGKDSRIEEDSDDGKEDDPLKERWWGFWDPAEIRKLAEWLPLSHELSAQEARGKTSKTLTHLFVNSNNPAPILDLSRKLDQYADLLAWRAHRQIEEPAKEVKEVEIKPLPQVKLAKTKEVSAKSFYG